MAAVSVGLTAFIRSGGRMRLVAFPRLSVKDAEAIAHGLQQREDVISSALTRELEQEVKQIVRDDATPLQTKYRLKCLAWLLANRSRDIKIAVLENVCCPKI